MIKDVIAQETLVYLASSLNLPLFVGMIILDAAFEKDIVEETFFVSSIDG